MANTITAEQIQEGDTIKVTRTVIDEDRKTTHTYEGVATNFTATHDGKRRWRTSVGWGLYTDYEESVIELLDRPKPKVNVPTGTFAQVTYQRHGRQRFAVLTPQSEWKVYDGMGDWQDDQTPKGMALLANENAQVTDFKVLFEGVAK